jgi:predicted ATP-dependent endonuclease of OLD family
VAALIANASIHGYRAARDVALDPRSLCAFVGEASSGKSTILTAIWTLLESAAPMPTVEDVSYGHARIHIEAAVRGRTIFLDAKPPATLNVNRQGAPPALFFPAALRGGSIVAPATAAAAVEAAAVFRGDRGEQLSRWAADDGGLAFVGGIEQLAERGQRGLVLLIEEPELYLSPQSQRHLYRLLRALADGGNQVLYTTHAPVFLSVERLEELAVVRHSREAGTRLVQPEPLRERQAFRALAEFDAGRAELFLSRAALLVEGRTEKLTFPFVFEALGFDPDREAVAILECGGKGNIPLFAEICNACGIPYVVVHDRDAPAGKRPSETERQANRLITDVAGRARTIVLTPDFEGLVGFRGNARRKPRRAWRKFSEGDGGVPRPLVQAVQRVVRAARN